MDGNPAHGEQCACANCRPELRKNAAWHQKEWVVPLSDGYRARLSIDREFDIVCFIDKPETKNADGSVEPEHHLAALAFTRAETGNLGIMFLEAAREAGAAWAAHDLRTNPAYKEHNQALADKEP